MKWLASLLCGIGLALSLAAAEAPAPPPAVVIELGARQAQATPIRQGFTHTGGGNIDVAQPSPDTVIITMTGVAVAGGHPCTDSLASLAFDLCQDFEIKVAKPEIKKVKVSLEARVIGLLRSHKKGCGSAAINEPAHAAVLAVGTPVVEVAMPGRSVAAGENLSINDRVTPVVAEVPPGKYALRQAFGVQAAHPRKVLPCKAASAEFAPDPALDPLWISAFEPFHGAIKKDFGFQVILKVSAD
jgi:hypothetical protein